MPHHARASVGRPGRATRPTALAAFALLFAWARGASADAEGESSDGAYGRLAGDVTLAAGVGAAIGAGGPSGLVEIGARYLSTAGLWVDFADALGGEGPVFTRSLGLGIEVSPLFLARWANDLERGPPTLDLALDSIAFGIGTFWAAPDASNPAGLELRVGLDVPVLGRATGPWIGVRGALRQRGADLAGRTSGDLGDAGAYAGLLLGWHHVVGANLVDASDGVSP